MLVRHGGYIPYVEVGVLCSRAVGSPIGNLQARKLISTHDCEVPLIAHTVYVYESPLQQAALMSYRKVLLPAIRRAAMLEKFQLQFLRSNMQSYHMMWPALQTCASNRLYKKFFIDATGSINKECLALHMHPRHSNFGFRPLGEPALFIWLVKVCSLTLGCAWDDK